MEESLQVHCPLHPKEIIQRVDLDPYSKAPFYCIECLFQLGSDKDKSTIKTFKEFIDLACQYYSKQTHLDQDFGQAPPEFLDIIHKKTKG